ncbi:MAG: M1 family peptidase, partial [Desulfobacteraceae bacterium]|nr:M1 family peptidase [Desulfobacteraceae bacterium]
MNSIKPINYCVRLEPDLEKFSFFGTIEILTESVGEASEIVLNILELAIWKCQVFIGSEFKDCAFLADPEKESLKIILPQAMTGNIRLKIEYDGMINNKMAGFYRSSYVREGSTRYIAVTQFEESDARR